MGRFLKKNYIYIINVLLIVVLIAVGVYYMKQQETYETAQTNNYNDYFYELVDYIENVETYLAKSTISTSAEHGAETLTNVWREANLAQTYLSLLPMESQELENTEKFLNQVSDYSYSLSRKNIEGTDLTEEDFKNLEELHSYCLELENTLNQLSTDISYGRITWKNMNGSRGIELSQQVSGVLEDTFTNLEENFHEYSGLIYDGAFSEHLTSSSPKMIVGNEITEDEAKEKTYNYVSKDSIKNIENLGCSENSKIQSYDFYVESNDDKKINISISKIGGYVVYFNMDRDVNVEDITNEVAIEYGKNYLKEKGFDNMKETYYIKNQGIITINYAATQNDVVIYPDLIKIKIALDNGEILGIETTGYLNCHQERQLSKPKISINEARTKLNKNLNIESEGQAIIPTEWKSEILCYEFKGKVNDTEFLVYINVESGEEEDILVIKDTPNGTLTM